jgi:hypothetical protein
MQVLLFPVAAVLIYQDFAGYIRVLTAGILLWIVVKGGRYCHWLNS